MPSAASNNLKKEKAYRQILDMILDGRVQNDHFPSEIEFCRQLGVSRVTLRSALLRLECEGMISRSRHYGTRIVRNVAVKKILIISDEPVIRDKNIQMNFIRLQNLMAACREHNLEFESHPFDFLRDISTLTQRYSGVFLFGAGFTGKESSLKVLYDTKLPTVYLREDHNSVLTGNVASVGCDVKAAWEAGFNYLATLGFRRIATLIRDDVRSRQRLGHDRRSFASHLNRCGYREAAEMIYNGAIEDFPTLIPRILEEKHPEAIYCYSDYYAAHLYPILYSLGKRIPEDLAIMGFGNGSAALNPPLSSVCLTSSIVEKTAVQLMLWLQKNPDEHPDLILPFHIVENDSTLRIKLDGLLSNNRQKTKESPSC